MSTLFAGIANTDFRGILKVKLWNYLNLTFLR